MNYGHGGTNEISKPPLGEMVAPMVTIPSWGGTSCTWLEVSICRSQRLYALPSRWVYATYLPSDEMPGLEAVPVEVNCVTSISLLDEAVGNGLNRVRQEALK